MRKKSLLSVLLAATTTAAFAAPQVPSYNEIDLTSLVSPALFHGNLGVVDFNSDDILDVFVKGRDLNNSWIPKFVYLTGDGYSFTNCTVVPELDGTGWERVVLPIDYNSDGIVDVIYGASYGSKLLKNDGKGNFTEVEGFALEGEISIDGNDQQKWYDGVLLTADFNLDGYPDVVTFNGNPREDQGTPTIYLNNQGNGTFTRIAESGLNPQRGGTMAIGDINGDGKPDLVVCGWIDNDRIRAYYCNGDGTFTAAETAMFDDTNRGTEKGHIILVDIDADGDLDLFVTGTSCPQGWARVADIYLNDGTGKFTYTDYGLPGVQASAADWCDLNADGNMDIVYVGYGSNGGVTNVAINQGNGTFVVKNNLISAHRDGCSVFAADVNGNGMMDILVMGYQDGSDHHFQLMNGLASRGVNSAPTAPTNLKASSEGGKVTFTWEAGSDAQTPTAALRYNVYVKMNDGRIITVVPANPASGVLRSVNGVSGALVGCSYTLNVNAADVAEWGVQTIDGCKLGSAFATSTEITSGAEAVKAEKVAVKCNGRTITVNADAQVSVIDFAGRVVANASVKAGEAMGTNLAAGVYVVEATTAQGKKIEKFIIK